MRGKQTAGPYKSLGQKLRSLRTQARESLSDTSGAVEVEVAELAKYESGLERPSEEILLLLISHFEPQDTEALKLWKLAGYNLNGVDIAEDAANKDDTLAIFTDYMEVSANQHGFILDFKQTTSPGQFKSIAKLGMSREHAQSMIQALAVALAKSSQHNRLLLPGQTDDKN